MSGMVGHGSGVGVPTSDSALLCPFLSKGTASSGMTTAPAFQGSILLPGFSGRHLPLFRTLHEAVTSEGMTQLGLRSQLQGEEVILPLELHHCGANQGMVMRIIGLLCVRPGRPYKVCEVLLFDIFFHSKPYSDLSVH